MCIFLLSVKLIFKSKRKTKHSEACGEMKIMRLRRWWRGSSWEERERKREKNYEDMNINKLALDKIFPLKEEGRCLFGSTMKRKGNLINTVSTPFKMFVSNVSLVCGIVLRRPQINPRGCLFINKKRKK